MSDLAETPDGTPFQSLYRRFRPSRFSEVRGQDHVTLALRNAVRDGRVAHAYLFSGPRGTGKTSTARILGKALNCLEVVDGEPCGACASCLSIANGSSFDVHELDAASNNGVDAMRDLVARANLATPGSSKVYIVDEVHMLSMAASNALLKTLEEPPDHVVFVLATTDPQKVLPTIRSRTQHFEFHLLDEEVLSGLLVDITAAADLQLPEGANAQAVRRARGSARDALSLLDLVAAAGILDDDTDELTRVIVAIGADDGAATLVALDAAVRHGRDPQQLAVEIVEALRVGFLDLAGAGTLAKGIARLDDAERAAAGALGLARCVRAMELVGDAIVAMRDAPEPRITLEVALYRCAVLDAESSPEALIERIERLERRLSEGVPAAPSGPPGVRAELPQAPSADAPAASAPPLPTVTAPPSPPERPVRAPTEVPAEMPPVSTESERSEPERSEPVRTESLRTGSARRADVLPPAPAAPLPNDRPAEEQSAPIAPMGARPALGAFRRERAEATPVTAGTSSAPSRSTPFADPSATSAAAVSREEFVTAWGDHVLTSLRAKARALFQVGRFVGAEGTTGIFALPNEPHVSMAAPHCEEVGDALSAHFGRRVTVRLVVDDGTNASEPTAASDTADSASTETPDTALPTTHDDDYDDLGTPLEEGDGSTVVVGNEWAEDRLRRAFPGAEEVTT